MVVRVGGLARVCKLCLYVTLQTILPQALAALANQTMLGGECSGFFQELSRAF